jgi:ADP-heptose:LPS heptosyltransferase
MDGLVLVTPQHIGDTLLATPAIRAYKRAHPQTRLTVCTADEGGPFQVLRHNRHIDALCAGVDPASVPGNRVTLDPEAALRRGYKEARQFAWCYGRQLGVEIDGTAYDYTVTPDEREAAAALLATLGEGKPVVVVARHSPTCLSNDPAYRRATKLIPNAYWLACAARLIERGYVPVAVGAREEADDPRYRSWPGKRLYGEKLRIVAALCAQCAGVLAIDNGIRHVAAAVGAHVYALSGWIHLEVIACSPVREGQRIVEEHVLVDRITTATVLRGVERLGL